MMAQQLDSAPVVCHLLQVEGWPACVFVGLGPLAVVEVRVVALDEGPVVGPEVAIVVEGDPSPFTPTQ